MDRCGRKLEEGIECTLNGGHGGAHYSWGPHGVNAWVDPVDYDPSNTKYEVDIPEDWKEPSSEQDS